jgi:hypothetical protein
VKNFFTSIMFSMIFAWPMFRGMEGTSVSVGFKLGASTAASMASLGS